MRITNALRYYVKDCSFILILGSLAACSYGARAFSGTGPSELPALEAGNGRGHSSDRTEPRANDLDSGEELLNSDGTRKSGVPFSRVNVLYCYDGDTCKVELPGLPPVFGHKLGVRLKGLDTPEIRGKCAKEKALAKEAKAFLWDLVSKAERVDLEEVSRGKYFRIVARIVADGVDTTEALISAGLAVRYDGGTKVKDWCK